MQVKHQRRVTQNLNRRSLDALLEAASGTAANINVRRYAANVETEIAAVRRFPQVKFLTTWNRHPWKAQVAPRILRPRALSPGSRQSLQQALELIGSCLFWLLCTRTDLPEKRAHPRKKNPLRQGPPCSLASVDSAAVRQHIEVAGAARAVLHPVLRVRARCERFRGRGNGRVRLRRRSGAAPPSARRATHDRLPAASDRVPARPAPSLSRRDFPSRNSGA